MRVVFIDHYDSFSFNVLDWLGAAGLVVDYVAYDDAARMQALVAQPSIPLVLSPGPKRPEDAGPTVALARASLGRVPIFGVCLGHQVLGYAAGALIRPAAAPFHGSRLEIRRTGAVDALLEGIPARFYAATYNSLVVDAGGLPPAWQVTAICPRGEVQAMAYEPESRAPAYGVQFHPESYLSEQAAALGSNIAKILRLWAAAQSSAIDPLSTPS